MAETYGYFDGLSYDENFPMLRVASLVPNGVYNGELTVASYIGMKVNVNSGRSWINGYFYYSDGVQALDVATAHATLPRKDIIVLRLDKANKKMNVAYIKGNAESSPSAPLFTRVNTTVYELQLAEINVPAGIANLTQANITDTRPNKDLCGITAGFQGLDVQGLTAQAQAQFNAWFESMKNQLSTDAAGNLQNQIDAINDSKGKAGGMATLDPVTGKLDQMPTAADVGAATINGYQSITGSCTGGDSSNYHFFANGLEAGGIYLVAAVSNFNPDGSTSYRSTTCAIVSLPIGYNSSTISVAIKINVLSNYSNTDFNTNGNFTATFESGSTVEPLTAYNLYKHIYIHTGKTTGTPDISESIISIRKLV